MEKLKEEAYNVEIAHCPGRYRSACRHCLRAVLYLTWCGMPATERESIILMPPLVDEADRCRNLVRMPRGYAASRSTPAEIRLTSRSGGVAV